MVVRLFVRRSRKLSYDCLSHIHRQKVGILLCVKKSEDMFNTYFCECHTNVDKKSTKDRNVVLPKQAYSPPSIFTTVDRVTKRYQ